MQVQFRGLDQMANLLQHAIPLCTWCCRTAAASISTYRAVAALLEWMLAARREELLANSQCTTTPESEMSTLGMAPAAART